MIDERDVMIVIDEFFNINFIDQSTMPDYDIALLCDDHVEELNCLIMDSFGIEFRQGKRWQCVIEIAEYINWNPSGLH